MEHGTIHDCIEEWETLSNEYRVLEKLHKEYCKKLEELTGLQQSCSKAISHQRYRINIIKQSLKKLDFRQDEDNREREKLLQTDFFRRKAQLYEMENFLPKQNGLYLKIILGNINVSILDKNDKFRYKDEYEKFKLVMSLICLALSLFNLFTNFRTMDLIHMFLLVWYYCTLTIRESILKVNGSRIKGWWRLHHFISTVLAGVLLIWPNGSTYYAFRRQFMGFNVFISFLQYLQFMYQRGCLYRLKALGETPNMDITVEGFHSWMWKGLGFLIPFLFLGYFWELYNAYILYQLSFEPSAEWHVTTLAILFLVLFIGNTFTTALVIPQKVKERLKFKYRFTRLDKYIWTHKKRRVSFRNPESPQKRTSATRAPSFSVRPGDEPILNEDYASEGSSVLQTENSEAGEIKPLLRRFPDDQSEDDDDDTESNSAANDSDPEHQSTSLEQDPQSTSLEQEPQSTSLEQEVAQIAKKANQGNVDLLSDNVIDSYDGTTENLNEMEKESKKTI